ncbi:MAG: SRPBCC domain-containing protein [Myxococcota bacterium]
MATGVDAAGFHARYRQGAVFPRSVSAGIEIDAAAEDVWSILTDFERYPEWNPFTVEVRTTLQVGEAVTMNVHLPGRRPTVRVEWVNRVEAGRVFAWGMHMLHPICLTANRYQWVEPLGDQRCRYRTEDVMSGWLAPVVVAFYGRSMRTGFESVANALKARAEKSALDRREEVDR